MTNKKQNIAVAEWMGFKHFDSTAETGDLPTWRSENRVLFELPDFDQDLNAMHEAVYKLPVHLKRQFSLELRKVVSRFHTAWETFSEIEKNYYVENATASQRREALLQTIGKWKH